MITVAPALVEREATPYVALPRQVPMGQLDQAIPAAVDEVFDWLQSQAIEPAGVPLIRYRIIDMDTLLHVEIGFPVSGPVAAPPGFVVDELPAGTYGSATYQDVSQGVAGNASLIQWASDADVIWDSWDTPDGDAFAGRAEFFLTGPDDDPDPTTWLTEVVIKIAD